MRQLSILAAMLLTVAACNDDPAGPDTSLTAEQRADVAATTGEMVASDVGIMSHSDASGNVLFSLGGDLGQGDCSLLSGKLVCTATLGALDGQLNLTFADASGASQSDYDEQTTATVSANTVVSGEISRGTLELDFEHSGSFTISGLEGEETSRIWNGDATTTVTSSSFGGTRSYTFSASSNIDAIVVPIGGDDPHWPTSGRVTSIVQFTTASGSRTANVRVDFNGTSSVPITVDGTEFTLNLETHVVSSSG